MSVIKIFLCEVHDNDPFFKTIIMDFISRMENMHCLPDHLKSSFQMNPEIILIDPATSNLDWKSYQPETLVVVISADQKYLKLLFDKRIDEFLYKPDFNYPRFKEVINAITTKANSKKQFTVKAGISDGLRE